MSFNLTQAQTFLNRANDSRDHEEKKMHLETAIKMLEDAIDQNPASHGWEFRAQLDRETGERVGAGGTFQIVSLTDENDQDMTVLIDQGHHFNNLDEVKQVIADRVVVTEI